MMLVVREKSYPIIGEYHEVYLSDYIIKPGKGKKEIKLFKRRCQWYEEIQYTTYFGLGWDETLKGAYFVRLHGGMFRNHGTFDIPGIMHMIQYCPLGTKPVPYWEWE